MKRRCDSESSENYTYYGGRGISYCEKWNSFENFQKWALSNGYREDLTLDRIDNDGNYEPSNCRWATLKMQGNNKRNNKILKYKGKELTMSQWSDYLGIPYTVIRDRINKCKGNVDKALSMPYNPHKKLSNN